MNEYETISSGINEIHNEDNGVVFAVITSKVQRLQENNLRCANILVNLQLELCDINSNRQVQQLSLNNEYAAPRLY
jgi:hypothetical protein